jgi:hypothetical protein
MEQLINNVEVIKHLPIISNGVDKASTDTPFIVANTMSMDVNEMEESHIIPVFSSTNTPLISHNEFIETVYSAVQDKYCHLKVLSPSIRVSHPIKGRIPDAKHKQASELEPWEQTLFYERMMFVIEVPEISLEIAGNKVSLTIGGVKSYSNDNLYGKRTNGEQSFQLFIGFKNQVCCNLSVTTDGYKEAINVSTIEQLRLVTEQMLGSYDLKQHLKNMRNMSNMFITETEFAQFIGKSRMYKHLSEEMKTGIPELLFGDQQMGVVVKDYHIDENFCHDDTGGISLWRFYNLLTGVNKSTYIDKFLDRAINAEALTTELLWHKIHKKPSWYLS